MERGFKRKFQKWCGARCFLIIGMGCLVTSFSKLFARNALAPPKTARKEDNRIFRSKIQNPREMSVLMGAELCLTDPKNVRRRAPEVVA
jgi:hypothetical protein